MKLNEVVIKYHKTLNPKLWDKSSNLKDDVRVALVKLSQSFIDYLEIDKSFIQDVIITGSNCNYNWNNNSDLDVHVIVDYKEFQNTCNTVDIAEMFKTKKTLWNNVHDIDIKGIPTEMYVQDTAQAVKKDDASYSLLNNQWLVEPHRINPGDIDKSSVDSIVSYFKGKIDNMIKNKEKNLDTIKSIQTEIIQLRREGLDKSGQFSPENLAFKQLRNSKYIKKFSDYFLKTKDDSLSL